MNVAARLRVALARRPWVRWVAVVALALSVAQTVRNTDAELNRAIDRWGQTRRVLVATHEHRPGDLIEAEVRELPLVAMPPAAAAEIPTGSVTRHHLTTGEVIVDPHLAAADGPAALAAPGELVVAVAVSGTAPPPPGTRVHALAEGVVLAAGTVTAVEADTAWIAVPGRDGPVVADGARRNLVSLALVP